MDTYPATADSPELALDNRLANVAEAYEAALQEDIGYQALQERGLADMGSAYLRVEAGDQVYEGNAREAITQCRFLGSFSGPMLRAMIEEKRVEAPWQAHAAEVKKN
jgi:hypothetical protein